MPDSARTMMVIFPRRLSERISTGVSFMMSEKWTSSAPVHPDFWKSEMSTASRRCSVERARMLSASLSGGP